MADHTFVKRHADTRDLYSEPIDTVFAERQGLLYKTRNFGDRMPPKDGLKCRSTTPSSMDGSFAVDTRRDVGLYRDNMSSPYPRSSTPGTSLKSEDCSFLRSTNPKLHMGSDDTTSGVSSECVDVRVGSALAELQDEMQKLRQTLDKGWKDNEYEELNLRKTRKSEPKIPVSFSERCLESGFHRLHFIADDKRNGCAKVIWIGLFICCLGALCIQLWDRITLFATNPTHIMVDKRYMEHLSFPAVTICSLNLFRLTKIVDLNLYSVAHSLLHKEDSNWTARQLQGKRNLDSTYVDFLRHVAHQKEDLIESCSWYGKECGPANFTETITDYGLCFVFHPKLDDGIVRRAGQNAGLSLLLNVEHYEYLFGRKSSVGVRVSVHDSTVLPEVEAKGVNVPVGSFTTLMIQKVTEHHRPSTLANCVSANSKPYNRSVCLVDYEEEMIMKRCNCSTKPLHWNINGGKMKICSARDFFTCIVKVKARLNENKRVTSCPGYCDFTEYDITLSEAGLPVYAAEGRLQRLNKGGVLEQNFQQARDIYHRSDQVLLEHDIQTLDQILAGFNDTESSIFKMFAPLQEDTLRYENAFENLQEALDMLRRSTSVHYDAFYQSRHVDFCQETVTRHIEDNMDDILQAENVIEDIRNFEFSEANETLWKILRKIDRLVPRHGMSSKYSGFFVEVTNGIDRFRTDLLEGYGQEYREFKESKAFYSEKVDRSLNLTQFIKDSLLQNYNVISNITDMLSPRIVPGDRRKLSEDLIKNLTAFFRNVKYLKENPLPQLFSVLKSLDESYIPKRKKILALSDTLDEMKPYIEKIDHELDVFFHNVESTLTNLQSVIKSLSQNLADLAIKYKQNRFQKTELSEKINDDRLKAKVSLAESHLLQLRTIVSTLLETGRKISQYLEPIGHRWKDFTGLGQTDQNKLMSSLRFEALEKTVEGLSQRVEEQLSTLNDLQTELDDYHRGSRLNGKFYLNNFLQLEVYFPELTETVITHEETYGLIALACDIGSSLALYLGISLLTIFGLLDLVVRTMMGSGGSKAR